MDLGAYAQISNLSYIMEDNNINVPRLRGLRLMSQEEPLTEESIQEIIDSIGSDSAEQVTKQYDIFNKYCGRPDVLYIHARIGSGNWSSYNCDEIIKNQPWFLEAVEDSFDCTYVDIYAKIDENKVK